jgi:hypothetical protein
MIRVPCSGHARAALALLQAIFDDGLESGQEAAGMALAQAVLDALTSNI